MKLKAVRGTRDILPGDVRLWHSIEEKAKDLSAVYGYREIRTPLLEEAALFTRSIGPGSDIVRKQMYTFLDRKKRLLCLRPEATASVVRAYLEHGLDKTGPLAKLYYSGPMFRAERPQAGRLRQFHHIGVEAIGSSSPYLDAEIISLAVNILHRIGLKGFSLHLNSIGCRKDRERHSMFLKKALKNKLRFLCPDCRRRYKTTILRIFDCKNLNCKKITGSMPAVIEHLCSDCEGHICSVKEILDSLHICFKPNPRLVRGLDYYTRTCFEIIHPHLGAQNALGAGGRYNDLVEDLGGPHRPAAGFALGTERLIAALRYGGAKGLPPNHPCLFIAAMSGTPRQRGFEILDSMRKEGISSEMDYQDRSLKAQMRYAGRSGFRYVAILGEDELKKDAIILRDMKRQQQREIKIDGLFKELTQPAD